MLGGGGTYIQSQHNLQTEFQTARVTQTDPVLKKQPPHTQKLTTNLIIELFQTSKDFLRKTKNVYVHYTGTDLAYA